MKLLYPEYTHKNDKRILKQLLTADFKQVNLYEANKGAVLGDHYHKEIIEYFYVLKGSMIYNESVVVEKGDLFVVYPTEFHSLEVQSPTATFMTFLSQPYLQEKPDVYKQ